MSDGENARERERSLFTPGDARPVVFVDVDGVLNSRRYVRARGPRSRSDRLREIASLDLSFWAMDIDPVAMSVLNEILRRSGADAVISSAWRDMLKPHELEHVFRARGFDGRIIGQTPVKDWVTDGSGHIIRSAIRGEEIADWLKAHPSVTRFCIIDDGNDMGQLADWLVLIDPETGLDAGHVPMCLARLGA